MPTPREGESESDFVERCIPIVIDDGTADDRNQAVAVCHSLFNEGKSMNPNDRLLKAIKARQGSKQEPFNGGILTADCYVRTLRECVGTAECYKFAATREKSFDDVLRKAARTLTYNNPDMVTEEKEVDQYHNVPSDLELPKNTLMVMRYVTTTARKDRDGDILRTKGARPDPNRLILWQHVHTLPVGKVLGTAEHTDTKLSTWGAIVDMNELCHDAAVMIDNKMGRYSHGFRALIFEELKETEGETTGPPGFDIKDFEIMEDTVASVPSNTDAETEEVLLSLVEGGKLTSGLMKSMGRNIRERQPVRSAGGLDINININGGSNEYVSGSGSSKAKGEGQACGCGASKEADADAGEETEAKDEKMTCPECGSKMEDGVCKECGYEKDSKTSPDAENADAYNDMGPELCPDCSTVSLDEDGRCPNCGFVRERSTNGRTKSSVNGQKMYVYPGMIDGSWEYTEMKLRESARAFLIGKGVDVGEHSWVGLVATFADYAIISHERGMTNGEPKYYQAGWETGDDGDPAFVGDAKEVKIHVAAQVMEKLAAWTSAKAGRVISAKNMKMLQEVRDDLKEMMDKESSMSRGGTAMCERCVKKLSDVIGDMEDDEDKSLTDDAAAYFALNASKTQRNQMIEVLAAFEQLDERSRITEEYRALVGQG